jgi:hypothetical protein
MYISAPDELEDRFPLSSLGQAQRPPLARSSHAAQPLRRYPPFRTSLGQPATGSTNPWPCTTLPCTTQRVSAGDYGTALLAFTDSLCIPLVPQLLRLSPTFVNMAEKLDKLYIALEGPQICAFVSNSQRKNRFWSDEWGQNSAGVLTLGPFKGKRVLEVKWGWKGSYFEPFGSLDNNFSWDKIYIGHTFHQNTTRVIAEYIAHIAHETTHAFTMLHRTGSPLKTIPERVKAAIAEEADTRKTEARILAEITATTAGKMLLGAIAGLTGSTMIWEIQRDFFPGELKRTYLEHFVFSELALEAIQRERLTANDINRINKEVDALKIEFRSSQSIKSAYGQWRYLLRGIDLNWRGLTNRLGGEPRNTNPEKEKLLKMTALHFLGLAKYDRNPTMP